jgi:phage baseplate assembly protein W
MARNTRTFADLDFNFIPAPMAVVINEGIGVISASTTSKLIVGTRLWTSTTYVTAGQTFYWNFKLYTCTNSGLTGNAGPSHSSGSAFNGTAIFAFSGNKPTDAAVTNFTRYDMGYRNIYSNGVFIGKVKSTVDQYTLELYNNATNSIDLQNFTYSNGADVVKRYDEQAIKASVRNLILTSNYERPFHPEIGTQINSLLFEPATPMLSAVLERAIRTTINNFEPRVDLNDVQCVVNEDSNSVDVSIIFTILNTQTPQVLNLVLERTR